MLKTILGLAYTYKYSALLVFLVGMFTLSSSFSADSTATNIRPAPNSRTIMKPISVIESESDVQVPDPTVPTGTRSLKPAEYDTLPDCPKEPQVPPVPNQLNCRDINGVLRDPTTSENCPIACKVSATVEAQEDIISSYSPATCPRGYLVGASYKMDKEVLYDPNPPPYPTPIPNKATYDRYIAAHARCFGVNPTYYKSYCQSGPPRYTVGDYYVIDGAYVQIVDNNGATGRCYNKGFCPGLTTESCSYVTTDQYYRTPFQYIECTPRAGYFFTGKDAPTRKLCLRQHVKWGSS